MAELYEKNPDQSESTENYDPNEEEGAYDPFDNANVHQAQLIVLLRIYDLLAIQGLKVAPEATSEILELHKRGGLVSPPPYFIPPEDIEEAIENATKSDFDVDGPDQ